MSADFDLLAAMAEEASQRPGWDSYAAFARLRSRGLRADALRALDAFIQDAAPWPLDARIGFCRWLLEKTQDLPQPLYNRLVVPTLREWSARDPESAEAHLWLGLLRCDVPSDHLARALDLDPSCDRARWTLAGWITDDVWYNQHHLPHYYVHDPRDDLPVLDHALALIEGYSGHPEFERLRREVAEYRRKAEDWLAAHPREGDFAEY